MLPISLQSNVDFGGKDWDVEIFLLFILLQINLYCEFAQVPSWKSSLSWTKPLVGPRYQTLLLGVFHGIG